jgi:subtilisin family serine protease
MSLGAGEHSHHCDSGAFSSTKSHIDNLRSSQILSTISSGNNSFKNAIGAPACISSAVAVGNTTDDDTVNPTSNSAEILDLLAPGTQVFSSDLDPGLVATYRNRTGTSMAAPHVAGAIALIRKKHPSWTANRIENALKSHGPLTMDTNGLARRRLDVNPILNVVDPFIRAEYGGCSFGETRYAIDWHDMNNTQVTEWDADIAYSNGGTWYARYNRSNSTKGLQFTGGKRKVRVRGRNAQGWGSFRTTPWLLDRCDSTGGPEPKAIPATEDISQVLP